MCRDRGRAQETTAGVGTGKWEVSNFCIRYRKVFAFKGSSVFSFTINKAEGIVPLFLDLD